MSFYSLAVAAEDNKYVVVVVVACVAVVIAAAVVTVPGAERIGVACCIVDIICLNKYIYFDKGMHI